jgi:hypothetical protein
MSNALESALVTSAVAIGLATSAYAQSHSLAIHHYHHLQTVKRHSVVSVYQNEPHDDVGAGSDTAAALDE